MLFQKKDKTSKSKLDTYNIGMYSLWNNIRMSQAAFKKVGTKCALYIGIPMFLLISLMTWNNYPIESQSFKFNTRAWIYYSMRLGNPFVKAYSYYDDEKPMYDDFHDHKYKQYTLTDIGFNPAVQVRASDFRGMLFWNFMYSLITSIIIAVIANIYLYRKGIHDTQSNVVDGVLFEPDCQKVNKMLANMGLQSDLEIGGLNLVRDREKYHTKIVGNTGTGKTILISKLLEQINNPDNIQRVMNRTVVLDVDSVFCDKYYDHKTDIILNPFDSRCAYYNIFDDISNVYDVDNIAEILVPDVPSGDSFWHEGPRTIIAALLRTIVKKDESERTYENLLDKALRIKLEKLEEFIKGTDAANLLNGDIKKTALSLRSIILTHLRCFEPMLEIEKNPEARRFSFRVWIKEITRNEMNPTRNIFITYTNDQLSTLRPLMTFWISLLSSKITSLSRSDTRRIWLFIDELANLGKLNDLNGTLRIARNYGFCFVVGYQNISDIEDIYGRIKTSSILALFSTAFYFRPGEDDETAEKVSKNLGSQKVRKVHASKQYGVTDFRDGGSISEVEETNRIVSADALRTLADRQAFVILPTEVPRTRVRLYYPGEKVDMLELKYSKARYLKTGAIWLFFAKLFLSSADKKREIKKSETSQDFLVSYSLSDVSEKIGTIIQNNPIIMSIDDDSFFEDNQKIDEIEEVASENAINKDEQINKADVSKNKEKLNVKTQEIDEEKEQNATKNKDKEIEVFCD